MKITDYLPEPQLVLDVQLDDKEALLHFIADTYEKNGLVTDPRALYSGLKKREETMSTGVGGGIGIPHTTNAEARHASVMMIRLARPVDFQSLDEKPVDVVIALVIPEKDTTLHLRLLARISRLCRSKEFLSSIRNAESPKELFEKIGRLEEKMMIHG